MHVTGSGPFGGFGSVCKQVRFDCQQFCCFASCLDPPMLLHLCMSCDIVTEARHGNNTGTPAAFRLMTLLSICSEAWQGHCACCMVLQQLHLGNFLQPFGGVDWAVPLPLHLCPAPVYKASAHQHQLAPGMTTAQSLLQIIAHDGLPGFYRGCVTNLLRTTPAAALTFTSFELISRNLKTFAEDSR